MHPIDYRVSLFLRFTGWWSDIVPVRLTWVSSLFTLIGGGTAVMLSILFSVLSDLAPEAYRLVSLSSKS